MGSNQPFQSSPAPEDGCNINVRWVAFKNDEVSILTRPGGRVQPGIGVAPALKSLVSILTRPGGRVQLQIERPDAQIDYVSILTRPGGRVQLAVDLWGINVKQFVSILTRPGGRVQHRMMTILRNQ